MSSFTRAAWFGGVAFAAALLALPGNASAGFNVADFSCGSTPFSVNVDVRGLGSTDVCVTSSATVDLSCACVNHSGSCPQAANKATAAIDIQSAATIEPKNGRVIASLTVGPLQAPQFQGPNGQRRVLAAVSYANIVLTDLTNGSSIAVADTSRVFFAV